MINTLAVALQRHIQVSFSNAKSNIPELLTLYMKRQGTLPEMFRATSSLMTRVLPVPHAISIIRAPFAHKPSGSQSGRVSAARSSQGHSSCGAGVVSRCLGRG